jgi:succinate dehydrogenase/fumarate reductase flavoprotein subunit
MASEWDVIAVGAGLAGLTATNRALELGRRALVLERSTEPRHTCASRANGGVFHVGFRSVMTDPNELFRVVNAATGNFPDPLVARALADNALRSIEWLKSFGTKFVPLEPTDGWKEHTLHPLGFHNKTTMEWQDLGADRLITRLEQRVKELGGDSLRGARVTGLIIENGNVRGVTARTADGERSYRARAVVLADGGFESNKEMLRRYVTSHLEHLHMRAPESGNGDGMRMAEEAGGMLISMEAFYGHLLSADSLKREGLSPFPFLEFLAATGMMVDAKGERFVDETTGGHFTSNALARHGNALANVIFDDAMWNTIGKHFFCPPNPNLVNAGGTLHKANTIEELATKIGLAPARLRQLVDSHNAKVAANRAADEASAAARQAMPSYAKGKHPSQEFRTPPYYAAPACPAMTTTLGGIAIDQYGRVLHKDGGTLPGLYAAGATCGGLEGGPEVGYLGGLIKALVFGLLTAEHLAAQVKAAAGTKSN